MRIPILVQECLYLYENIDTDMRIPIPIPIPILVQEYLYLYENIDTDMRILIPRYGYPWRSPWFITNK